VLLYTVPTGHTIIVKSVAVRNQSASAGHAYFRLLSTQTIHDFNLGASGTDTGNQEWRPWLVLTEGQQFGFVPFSAAGVVVVVGGSLLFN
jgi:hypothetical protein